MGLRDKAKYHQKGLRDKAKYHRDENGIKSIDFNNDIVFDSNNKRKQFKIDKIDKVYQEGLRKKAELIRESFKSENQYNKNIIESNILKDDKSSEINNISNLKDKIEKLNRKILSLTTLIDISEDIQYSLNLDEVFQNVILSCLGQLNPVLVDIYIIRRNFLQKVSTSVSEDNTYTKKHKNDKIFFNKKNTNLLEQLKTTANPIKLDKIFYNGENERIRDLLYFKNNYIFPLIYDNNLEGFVYLDFSNKEDSFELNSEDINFLKNLSNISSIALKNISQYTYLENIITYYNNISQTMINIYKYSQEPSSKVINKVLNFIMENFLFDSIGIFLKSEDSFVPFQFYGELSKFKENVNNNLNETLQIINQYDGNWILENKIRNDNTLYDFLNTYDIKIPEGILIKRIVNRNIEIGIIIITSNNIIDDFFLTSTDFDYVLEIITLLLSYHLSSFTI